MNDFKVDLPTGKALRALAFLAHQLRPPGAPGWDEHGIVAKLEHALHAGRRLPDLALATLRAAADPANRTPAVIPLDGPHWAERVTPKETAHPKPFAYPVPTLSPEVYAERAAEARRRLHAVPSGDDAA